MSKVIIKLRDDEGKPLGITLIARDQRLLTVRGLRTPFLLNLKKAIPWAEELMFRAKTHELDGESKVKVNLLKSMTTRNAIRLGFAIRQILLGGPTYFTQEFCNGGMTITDVADHTCPDIELVA